VLKAHTLNLSSR